MSSFAYSTSHQNRVRIYNERDLRTHQITPGSRLQVQRGAYSHWVLYLGDGKVCHLTVEGDLGETSSKITANALYTVNAVVKVQSFSDMMKGDDAEVYVDNSADSKWAPLPPQEIIARAKSKEGQSEYGLLHYNCESFVNWCRYNKTESDQVNTVGKLVKILGGAALGMLGSSST